MELKILVNDADSSVITNTDVITFASNKLFEQNLVQEEYISACVEREKKFPTGLLMKNGVGIAIPHSNHKLVKQNSISIVRTNKDIEFRQMEDDNLKVSCQIIFNLALKSSAQHLFVLRKLFGLLKQDEFISYCLENNNGDVQNYILHKLN